MAKGGLETLQPVDKQHEYTAVCSFLRSFVRSSFRSFVCSLIKKQCWPIQLAALTTTNMALINFFFFSSRVNILHRSMIEIISSILLKPRYIRIHKHNHCKQTKYCNAKNVKNKHPH